jgi:hypothetical protein
VAPKVGPDCRFGPVCIRGNIVVSLDDPEAIQLYKILRRSRWANKFGTFWQLAQSAVCGTPKITPELERALFQGNFERMFDPSFDVIPYLAKHYRWDEKGKKYVKRKPRERLPDCPFPIVYGNRRDLGRCSSIVGEKFQQPQRGVLTEQQAFEEYRESITVNAWLARHGALAVVRTADLDTLDHTLRPLINRATNGERYAELVSQVLRFGPTRLKPTILGRPERMRPRQMEPPPRVLPLPQPLPVPVRQPLQDPLPPVPGVIVPLEQGRQD